MVGGAHWPALSVLDSPIRFFHRRSDVGRNGEGGGTCGHKYQRAKGGSGSPRDAPLETAEFHLKDVPQGETAA